MYKEDCEVSKSLVNTGLDSLSNEETLQLDDNLKPLSVFPNPFQNYISIQSPQKDQMVLKSVEGKIIGIYNIEEGLTKINSSFFNDGMYIITFMNQNKTFKLIKQ
ncbi:hypothetical protein CW751_00445 [Brumimicrobium salinarum]|uniref:Secretion system C-terminal sorting domain-containing protein n=1 Tax=Brumimicrobium salinarum TaxID=2058658 RepID=A0A2I0R5H6_9FLAO|nr:T9SS type A sorting domain-containing protein [Brumimicrobium salinarum]PKR81842.1 hypothetical protein CW751_00445 [Brumimicrobium salinarum]